MKLKKFRTQAKAHDPEKMKNGVALVTTIDELVIADNAVNAIFATIISRKDTDRFIGSWVFVTEEKTEERKDTLAFIFDFDRDKNMYKLSLGEEIHYHPVTTNILKNISVSIFPKYTL